MRACVRPGGFSFPLWRQLGPEKKRLSLAVPTEIQGRRTIERERETDTGEGRGRDGGSELSSLRSAGPPQLPLFYCPIVEERARARDNAENIAKMNTG